MPLHHDVTTPPANFGETVLLENPTGLASGEDAKPTHALLRSSSRRLRSEGDAVDPRPGYRNGFGKPRRLSLSNGTITLRRPRVRGLSERFESRLLPAFKRRTEEVGQVLPELYLHGLAQGDFDLALRGLLGEGARCPRRRSRG